jgi:predicted ribosomally synthesized peptide with SipW-like signal peptide
MIGLVVMMLGVGSWAVFNDTESGEYTATAGSLDLELNEEMVVPAEIGDLKPSEWHYLGPFRLHNAGANSGVLDLHFMDVTDSGGVLTEPEMEIEGENPPIDDISNWIDVDWFIDLNKNGEWDAGEPSGLEGKLGDIESRTIDLGHTMVPSEWIWVWISFHLQQGAGNEYQGDESTFDIVFTLHQPTKPAGATTVRLENKEPPSWASILGDDLYGSVTYWVGSGLHLDVEAHGLKPLTTYQLSLTGQGSCLATDDLLADGGTTGWGYNPLYIAGYWNAPPSGFLEDTCGTPGQGTYNYAHVQSDASGNLSDSTVIPADSSNYPGLPSGVYKDVKYIIKEVTNYPPGDSWTGVLMEMSQTLNFNLQ